MTSIVSRRFSFLGLSVDAFSADEALARIAELARIPEPSSVLFLNIDVIVKADRNPELAQAINQSDLSLMDGKPPLKVANRMGVPLPEKVSGSDFVPRVCAMAAEEGLSVFILGGAKGVPEEARGNLVVKYPSLRVVGTYSPKIGFETDPIELARMDKMILKAKPDILLVCLSCPKQEVYVANHKHIYRAPVSISCGATVDFLAGRVQRAPVWVSGLGLEWLWRFIREPRRLFRRYFIDSWHFLTMLRRYERRKQGA